MDAVQSELRRAADLDQCGAVSAAAGVLVPPRLRAADVGLAALAVDDAVGEVSGAWVTGRPPSSQAGVLFYVMVDSVAATLGAIVVNGGEIAQAIGADAPEITARFRDPAGNLIGLYQEPASS